MRASMHFEGWQYSLGDFTVCVGRATLKPNQEFRGFVVEIQYHPVDDLLMGQEILQVKLMGQGILLVRIHTCTEPHSKCS